MAYAGCFKRLDLVGLDDFLERETVRGREPWGPILERVQRGELGMKSGKGFYDWPGDAAKRFHRKQKMELIRLMKKDMEEGSV